ncbi:MAG: glycosyltransferase family 4 protein [Elusimicrobiota bacterium]
MKRLVFLASHLGYPMEKTPLGGGAMVALHLAELWAKAADFETTALGSGPLPPAPGMEYVRIAERFWNGAPPEPARLSETEYARFCRAFEDDATQWLLSNAGRFPPDKTAVVINDIAESPDWKALSARGYRPVSLWHVDVADYFCRMYLKGVLSTQSVVGFYEFFRRRGAGRLAPEILRLVFEKQRDAVVFSGRMIFPSRSMAQVVQRSYGPVDAAKDIGDRSEIIPWGSWEDGPPAKDSEIAALRARYQIRPETSVIMTLSRISPEKGLHLLIKAAKILERSSGWRHRDICLLICGEPAFMRGESYWRNIRRLSRDLRRARAFFPGYLGSIEKKTFLSLATVFVSPSLHESYGLGCIEAMKEGRPVLAFDHYGSRDWPREDFARVIAVPRSRHAPRYLAAALDRLLSDPENLKRMGNSAARFAQSQSFASAAKRVIRSAFFHIDQEDAAAALKVE